MGIKFPQKAHLPFLASAVHCVWCFYYERMIVSGEFSSLCLRLLIWKDNEEAHSLLGSLHPEGTQYISKERRKRGWMWSLETVMIRYSILLNLFFSTPNIYTHTHTPRHQRYKLGVIISIQKMKIMAYGPITSWEMDGETVETVSDFIFLGSKITADGDCSHEIKRRLLLGRKVMTNLESIFKSRDIALPTKVCLVKAMVFPVIMYGCESWTVKKAEHWKLMLLNCGVGEDSWESLGL